MQDLPTYHLIAYVLSFLGYLIVLIGCIVLLIKKRSLATVLMFTGMILSVIFTVLGFFMNFIAAKSSPEELVRNQGVFSTMNALAYLLFGIGILLLAINWSRARA